MDSTDILVDLVHSLRVQRQERSQQQPKIQSLQHATEDSPHSEATSKEIPLGEIRPKDEFANFFTHALGFFLSVPAAALLQRLTSDQPYEIALAIDVYCGSLIGLYAASSLSHAFFDIEWRRFYRMLDQLFIFLLIAGSFTPFAVAYNDAGWQSPLLLTEWILTAVGVALCIYFWQVPPRLRLSYGFLGWLPALSLRVIIPQAPWQMVGLLFAGGLFYTVGVLFLVTDHRVRYLHALWHTFVIGGSTCHYLAILIMLQTHLA